MSVNVAVSTVEGVRDRVSEVVSGCLGLTPAEIDPREPLALYGLDSLRSVELGAVLEDAFDRSLPDELLADHPSIDALVRILEDGEPDARAQDNAPAGALMRADAVLPSDIRPGAPSGARVSGGARRRGGGGRRRRPVGAGAAPAPGSDRAPRSPSPRARALRRAGRTPAASHARLLRHVAERLTRRVGPGAGAAGRRGADRCDGGPRGVVGRPRRRRTRRSCRDPRGLVRTGGRPQAPTVDRPRRHVREHGRDDAAVAGVGQPRETPSRGVGRRFADSDPAYARRVGRDLVARARGLAAHPHPQRLQSAERRNS